eukprot:10316678-Alexandrium_andersonii.AAC.1
MFERLKRLSHVSTNCGATRLDRYSVYVSSGTSLSPGNLTTALLPVPRVIRSMASRSGGAGGFRRSG